MKQILQNTSIAKFLSFTIIAILILSGELQAQPGTLDSSFGTNGKVVTTMSGYAFCTALQEDGKIIVAGLAKPEEVLILARYNIDGNLDSSFGENGKVLTDLVPGYNFNYSQAKALAFQKDGKIVVTGYGYRDIGLYSDYDILLVRYNADGSLDAGFGNNGVVINDFGDPNEFSYDVALQPDGKIVIGGLSGSMLVARYNTDGSPDITFGDVGWKKYNTGFANTIAIQPDAKIILGGVNSDKYTDRFMLCRIQSDGNVDNSFGNNGTVVTDFAPGSGDEQINSIVLQPDGKIIAGGSTDLENGNIALARYQLNGLLDTSFGINGKVTTQIEGRYSNANKILLAADKIIVAGSAFDFAILRYNKDGTLNDHFGTGGIQITDMGGTDRGYDAVLQPDGKIVLVGTSFDLPTGNKFAIARYNGDRPENPVFSKIKKWLHRHGFTWDDFPHLAPGGSIHVERSANGTVFNTIANITAHNNNQPNSFEDPAPLAGTNYYRLTAVAANGGNISSNVIAIDDNNAASIKVYPNPVKDNLQVSGLSAIAKTTLSITDLSGNRSAAVTVTGSSYNWNVSRLKLGSYILKIVNGNAVVTRMFVKQ